MDMENYIRLEKESPQKDGISWWYHQSRKVP